MLYQKQFGCLKFLSVNFNDTQLELKLKSKKCFCLQRKNFPPDKWHPGHRCRYGKYGPRYGYGFLRTVCQPARIENFVKPYNIIKLYINTENVLYLLYIKCSLNGCYIICWTSHVDINPIQTGLSPSWVIWDWWVDRKVLAVNISWTIWCIPTVYNFHRWMVPLPNNECLSFTLINLKLMVITYINVKEQIVFLFYRLYFQVNFELIVTNLII
jgi:hypothetical protein